MRQCYALFAAAALFLSPALADSVLGQQANYAHELMVGEADSVDRTTSFIP